MATLIITNLLLLQTLFSDGVSQAVVPVLTPPPSLPLAVNCTHIKISPLLCTSCRMRPFDERGKFVRQKDIYRLGSRACQRGLRRYAAQNPCDTIRVAQIGNQDAPGVRRDLAQFMYSTCETCCDCLPIGARPGEWEEREAMGFSGLFRLRRGNCPVHTLFDVCKIWPFVRSVVSPGQEFKTEWPEVCPLLMKWLRTPAANGWQTNNSVVLEKDIRRFIRRFVNVMKCKTEIVWEECAALEFAQGRI